MHCAVLLLLYTTQYYWLSDTIITIYYVVFSKGGHYFYYTLRAIYGGILFILCTLRYFRGVDSIFTYTTLYFQMTDAITPTCTGYVYIGYSFGIPYNEFCKTLILFSRQLTLYNDLDDFLGGGEASRLTLKTGAGRGLTSD